MSKLFNPNFSWHFLLFLFITYCTLRLKIKLIPNEHYLESMDCASLFSKKKFVVLACLHSINLAEIKYLKENYLFTSLEIPSYCFSCSNFLLLSYSFRYQCSTFVRKKNLHDYWLIDWEISLQLVFSLTFDDKLVQLISLSLLSFILWIHSTKQNVTVPIKDRISKIPRCT